MGAVCYLCIICYLCTVPFPVPYWLLQSYMLPVCCSLHVCFMLPVCCLSPACFALPMCWSLPVCIFMWERRYMFWENFLPQIWQEKGVSEECVMRWRRKQLIWRKLRRQMWHWWGLESVWRDMCSWRLTLLENLLLQKVHSNGLIPANSWITHIRFCFNSNFC